jgi:hypothetical protein
MFLFFDYVFYKSCNLYAKKNPDGAGLSGLSVLVLMHVFNLLSILFLVSIILENKRFINKFLVLALFVFLFIVNGIRYNKITYVSLKERWDCEDKNRKNKRQALVLIYIIGSVALLFGLAIYLGSKAW